ncbi:MAG: biotin-dependent carboxyltransferase family protein [Clostridiales bacterium]|jgi:biotin-dependent carboxylase-like uncharacterized protein|nr:biotin-dependent carboxyltransferase family protein [Clostridiales bacterium]
MGIKITNVGPVSTIQDAGRTGFMAFGFQASGAMDKTAFNIANILVGNDKDESAIEMTLVGISGRFTSDAVIAITGADVSPEINGGSIPRYMAINVKEGDVLTCSFAKSGCRAYLAVQGGFYLKKVMGSYSTNIKCGIGGYMGRPLKNGDLLYFNSVSPLTGAIENRKTDIPVPPAFPVEIRAVLGPQDDYFTDGGIAALFGGEYKVTNDSDRMGIKLDGAAVESKNGVDIISDGIPLGAIQIPASGKPIIMAADRQTVGGYAKIAVVISSDMPLLAQLKPGDTLTFKRASLEEAQRAYFDGIEKINALQAKFGRLIPPPPAAAAKSGVAPQKSIMERIKKLWKG